MRLFESLLLILLLLQLFWPALAGHRPRVGLALPVAALLLFAIHGLWEGLRWQMIPAYVLLAITGLLALGAYLRGGPARRRRWPTILAFVLGLPLWLLAVALPWALPVPGLPAPTGPYLVGTVSYHLIDENRPETYSPDPDDARQFMAQLWYPAASIDGAVAAPYIDHVEIAAPILAESFGFPRFLFNHLNLARTDGYLAAPPAADGPFPVLVFAHGLTGFRGQNGFQMQELASQGYVVAAIDHTYGSRFAIFPDGTVVEYDAEVAFPPGVDDAGNRLVQTWAGDISYLLDQMEMWTAGATEPGEVDWTGRLDLDHLGLFGHSTGGGTALEVCGHDERCDAALGLDAWVEPVSDDVRAAGLSQPLLFLSAPDWISESNQQTGEAFYAASAADRYLLTVAGSDHFDFTDFPDFSPLTPYLGVAVTDQGAITQAAVQAYTLAFFNHYLRGTDEPLLTGPSPRFPTLTFRHD
ncbi:MAG: hypothetical protein H6651_11225 [Ardenticatenales bacterium]|nr:hypothetical protein [Ardenticatenales bacterium]